MGGVTMVTGSPFLRRWTTRPLERRAHGLLFLFPAFGTLAVLSEAARLFQGQQGPRPSDPAGSGCSPHSGGQCPLSLSST